MALGSPFLTSYDDRMLERAFAETAPGQADIVDLDSLHTCSECAHWRAGRGKGKTGYCHVFMKLALERAWAEAPRAATRLSAVAEQSSGGVGVRCRGGALLAGARNRPRSSWESG
jgi:hypothetical protein